MKFSQDRRLWMGGGAGAAALVLAGGWLLLVAPEHSTVGDLHEQARSVQTANAQLQQKVTALKRANAGMPALVAQLRTARTQLPIHADLPAVIDQLDAQARHAGLCITSLAIGAVTAVADDSSASGTTASGTTGSGATGSGSADSGSADSGSAATASASPDSVTATGTTTTGTSTVGPAGLLFGIQLTLITHGSLRHQESFVAAVQYSGQRASLVSSAQLAAVQGAKSQDIAVSSDMTTQLTVFVAPQTPAVAAQLAKQLSAQPLK